MPSEEILPLPAAALAQGPWEQVIAHLFPYGNFTRGNLMPIFDSAEPGADEK
ncbi:hypothetical protein QQY24_32385 [Streptomyces sp. TG1A-8]|uniref:hypothetical protein n=1 Tax=Streptomyces sp. TG1A-8 TaxID=3051385 RepID=UPI00265BE355|nr:hypothetical protein [Streptomyces sp. TG1A-8]MDO0929816.1 hypothetical protein [Streptomyces sp. TG1A-8]